MPPTKKTGGQQDDLMAAISQVKTNQDRRTKRSSRRKTVRSAEMLVGNWVKKLLVLVVVALVALLVDGVRREANDFKAYVTAFSGNVQVTSGGKTAPATMDQKLLDDDVVETAAGATCTLVMSEGSAVQMEPGTRLTVRVLDYCRGGRRDRSFMVERGSAISTVGKYFGAESQSNVVTPTAVAAVRGTAFRVAYDPATQQTAVQTVEGKVDVRTPVGVPQQVTAGRAVGAAGYSLAVGGPLDEASRRALTAQATRLRALETDRTPNKMNALESTLTAVADPVLQLLGICPGGWGYNSIDSARRSACMEALRTLRTNLTSLPDPPEVINPWTLAELNLDPKEKKRLVKAFLGQMIDKYEKREHDWTIEATCRDKRRTRYVVTEGTLEKIQG
ncbi:MAG: FecR domain-containing protein [Armatimonadetes bacterium]|nr:FecR domain-containing protein [Armatimonadota bacterium]